MREVSSGTGGPGSKGTTVGGGAGGRGFSHHVKALDNEQKRISGKRFFNDRRQFDSENYRSYRPSKDWIGIIFVFITIVAVVIFLLS